MGDPPDFVLVLIGTLGILILGLSTIVAIGSRLNAEFDL